MVVHPLNSARISAKLCQNAFQMMSDLSILDVEQNLFAKSSQPLPYKNAMCETWELAAPYNSWNLQGTVPLKNAVPDTKNMPAILPSGCWEKSQIEGWGDIVDVQAPDRFSQELLTRDFSRWIVWAEGDFLRMIEDVVCLPEELPFVAQPPR